MPTSTLKNYENKIRFMIDNPPEIEPIIDLTSNKNSRNSPTGLLKIKFLGFTMLKLI